MKDTPEIRAVASAKRRVASAEVALRAAISAAFHDRAAGHTVEDIARAAGLTKQRIYQIGNEQEGVFEAISDHAERERNSQEHAERQRIESLMTRKNKRRDD